MSGYSLTVVVDNQAADGLVAEHGFALAIETPERKILMDTGQRDALLPNLAQLGFDVADFESLVISHGHYDHTGGVAEILGDNKDIAIYLHSAAFQPRYSLDGDSPSIVRMGHGAMEAVMNHPDEKINWLARPLTLQQNIGLTGPIRRLNDFEDSGGSFYLDPDGSLVDTIKDDNGLWIHDSDGLVVCLGCCHSGLVNTLDHICTRTGEARIKMIIGGMHLLHADEERLARTVRELARFSIEKIVACHCSGEQAVAYLREHLACEVEVGYAGLRIDL